MSRRFAGSNKSARAIIIGRHQRGFTLLETLIAMTLGLMVLAGVLQFASRLVEANTTTLKVTRLEQDIRTLMDMMVQDVRRSGQFPEAAADLGDSARFMLDQPTAPMVDGNAMHAAQVGASLSYAYRESDGKLVSGSFRHDAKAGTILMHTGTASAPETISDPAFMTVTQLEFTPIVTQTQAGHLTGMIPAIQIDEAPPSSARCWRTARRFDPAGWGCFNALVYAA